MVVADRYLSLFAKVMVILIYEVHVIVLYEILVHVIVIYELSVHVWVCHLPLSCALTMARGKGTIMSCAMTKAHSTEAMHTWPR